MDFIKEPGRIYAQDESGKLVAEIDFPSRNGLAAITHTFVDDSLRGHGIASQLVSAAVDQIRTDGMKARPICSYASKWFSAHPEAADLL